MHILDIAQNSISAGASLVEIAVTEDEKQNVFSFSVSDNGKGMSPAFLKKVTDPFTTTRTTRRVGLGLPLLKAACRQAGGELDIWSEPGVGTRVTATFGYDNIDRQPLGDIAGTMMSLITLNPQIDFCYRHKVGENEFSADTREMKEILGGVPLSTPEVALWLAGYFKENIQNLYGGCTI